MKQKSIPLRASRRRAARRKLPLFALCVLLLAASPASGCADGRVPVRQTAVPLPEPSVDGGMPLEQALLARRSVRAFDGQALSLREIAQLLWAGQGVTSKDTGFRTAPSAGALYPIELFVVCAETDGLEAGVYRYRPDAHQLVPVAEGDRRGPLCRASLSQQPVAQAPFSIVIAADYARTTGKYGERGVRYAHMEAGHTAQNIGLQAVALGLGAVCIGAFDDALVGQAIGLPGELQPLYVIPVGKKA